MTPLDKAWEQFRRDVTFIRDRDSVSRGNDSHSDIRIWCDKMLGAIQKRNFTLFNYLTHQHQAVEDQPWLVKDLHYPDPKEPGLTPAEIADFSKFIKPETNDKTVQ